MNSLTNTRIEKLFHFPVGFHDRQ